MVPRILVVDDESYVRDLLTRVLTRRGHDVDSAGDGETALELLSRHKYDLVLTDDNARSRRSLTSVSSEP